MVTVVLDVKHEDAGVLCLPGRVTASPDDADTPDPDGTGQGEVVSWTNYNWDWVNCTYSGDRLRMNITLLDTEGAVLGELMNVRPQEVPHSAKAKGEG